MTELEEQALRRKILVQNKQIKYLLHYVGGIVLPTQMNAIVERLEKIENDTKCETD